MGLPHSQDVAYSRSGAIPAVDEARPGALTQIGRTFALPLLVLSASTMWLWRGASPHVTGAVSLRERWVMLNRLQRRLQTLRETGMPFELNDAVPFRWRRIGVFGPLEDPGSHFPHVHPHIVRLLQTCERSVVILERTPQLLVYITFGPRDDVPAASDVCIAAERIVVSHCNRDCVDYIDFSRPG